MQSEVKKEIGQTVRVPIVPSPSRQIWEPDQSVVAGAVGMPFVELVFLKTGINVESQTGRIIGIEEGTNIEIKFDNVAIEQALFDIGHVRLPARMCVELLKSISMHLVNNGLSSRDDLLSELQDALPLAN